MESNRPECSFLWPTSGWVIATSTYLDGRLHCGSVDLSAHYWTPITAARGGRVVADGRLAFDGTYQIHIDHGRGWWSCYYHLIRPSPLSVGQEVNAGDLVGYLGRTGGATLQHLHFAIWQGNQRQVIPGVHPYEWVRRGDAIPGEYPLEPIAAPPFAYDVRSAVDGLEVRMAPRIDADIAQRLGSGSVLTVTDTQDGFYRVVHEGGEGWVVMSGVEPTVSALFDVQVVPDGLPVRTGPGEGFPRVAGVPGGALLVVYAASAGWFEIQYSTDRIPQLEYGWIPASGVVRTESFLACSCVASLPLRAGPGADQPTIGTLDTSGTQRRTLVVAENRNGWYRLAAADGAQSWCAYCAEGGSGSWIEGWKTTGRVGMIPSSALKRVIYPRSFVVRAVSFEPAHGTGQPCGGWPLTWGDDDCVYTAWCADSGRGDRSDIIAARVAGEPPHLRLVLVTPRAGEAGQEPSRWPRGRASGLVMADGVLYLWACRASGHGTGAGLAWSPDHGRTWEWADWQFPQLGAPVWLNAGRNHHGARDDCVYFYSPAAREEPGVDNGLILGRVRRDAVRDRRAYEFYCGFDSGFHNLAFGEPQWTPEPTGSMPVLESPRSGMQPMAVFDSGLGRCLLFTTAARDRSATHPCHFDVFAATDPWGPWNTVYFDDLAGTVEAVHEPGTCLKWFGTDGASFWLTDSDPTRPGTLRARRVTLERFT